MGQDGDTDLWNPWIQNEIPRLQTLEVASESQAEPLSACMHEHTDQRLQMSSR